MVPFILARSEFGQPEILSLFASKMFSGADCWPLWLLLPCHLNGFCFHSVESAAFGMSRPAKHYEKRITAAGRGRLFALKPLSRSPRNRRRHLDNSAAQSDCILKTEKKKVQTGLQKDQEGKILRRLCYASIPMQDAATTSL